MEAGERTEIGSVVISAAGHDKGGVLAVVGIAEAAYVLLADGKRRKLEKPKKKKLKHLVPLGKLPVRQWTNRQLRAALKEFGGRQP